MAKSHAAPQAHKSRAVNKVAPVGPWICIRVVNEKDAPLAGIEVSVKQGARVLTRKTGKNGRVYLSGLRAETCQVVAVRDQTLYEFVQLTSGPVAAPAGAGAP
ncbi:MAG: hypothetical protein ABSH05_26675 [Bryobacteraceae bacterium]